MVVLVLARGESGGVGRVGYLQQTMLMLFVLVLLLVVLLLVVVARGG